jgi:hypothetical protein
MRAELRREEAIVGESLTGGLVEDVNASVPGFGTGGR